jgi:hypothetical protein
MSETECKETERNKGKRGTSVGCATRNVVRESFIAKSIAKTIDDSLFFSLRRNRRTDHDSSSATDQPTFYSRLAPLVILKPLI